MKSVTVLNLVSIHFYVKIHELHSERTKEYTYLSFRQSFVSVHT